MEYVLHILVLLALYAASALALDLVVGRTGLVSLTHAAFHGLGAYTTALLSTQFDTGFGLALCASVILGSVGSLAVSLPSLRLRDDYFVIATFGCQMFLFSVFNNWLAVTRGPLGIPGIPQPTILGWRIRGQYEFAALCVLFVVMIYVVIRRLAYSPFGRVLCAIREDEDFAEALGKNTFYFKVAVVAVSSGIAAATGCIYAYYVTFIDPTSFTINESIMLITMVIIGGPGSMRGPVVGAGFVIALPEALRFAGFPVAIAANLQQIVYGTMLVAFVMFRPRGLMGRYDLTARSLPRVGDKQ